MKTFNGNFYTDFEVKPLPAGPPRRSTATESLFIESNEFNGVRVGHGGPELKFDAFNGDIRIVPGEHSENQSSWSLLLRYWQERPGRRTQAPKVTVPFSDPSRPHTLKGTPHQRAASR